MQLFLLFLEGIITFVSPCLLPMLPVYISYFAGGEEKNTYKTFFNALAFVIGFTTIFVLMGALAGSVGSFFVRYRSMINIITGSVVIFFGLNFLGIFKLNIFKGISFSVKRKNMSILSAFVFGAVFSVGWTPCVGAFLSSALMMASREGDVIQGVLMLLVYSLGLGIPFLICAVLIDRLKNVFGFIKKHYNVINVICGAVLVIVGVLMITGMFDFAIGAFA